MRVEPAARDRRPHRRPGRQVDLAPRAPDRRARPRARRASRTGAAPATPSRRSRVVRALGVQVDEEDVDTLVVHGAGLRGLRAPDAPLDCGNAGTLARLVAGILAFQDGPLRARRRRVALAPADGPDRRAARPDGRVDRVDRRLPAARRRGRASSTGIDYTLPVASAQVKSAILLAGLGAQRHDDGARAGADPRPHRADARRGRRAGHAPPGLGHASSPAGALRLPEVLVPGDISSAAPFLVAAALLPGSTLTVHDVGLNPLRTGILDVLERMGARVGVLNRRRDRRRARSATSRSPRSELVATTVGAAEVPRLVDELPLVALLGAFAHGTTDGDRRRGAAREGVRPDRDRHRPRCARSASGSRRARTASSSAACRRARAAARSTPAATTAIAMLGAIAGAVSREGVRIEGAESAAISFPGFYDLLADLVRRRDRRVTPVTAARSPYPSLRDRRHRRARRGRQEHRRPARSPSGSASATSTPARCTASLTWLALRRGLAARRRAPRSARSPSENPVSSTGRPRLHRRHRRHRLRSARSRDRPDGAGRRPAPRGARGDARAAARARGRRATR